MERLSKAKLSWFITAFIVLMVSYVLLFVNLSRFKTQNESLQHTYKIILRLTKLESDVKGISMDYRNLLLYDSIMTTTYFDKSMQAARQNIKDIKELTHDNPIQQTNISTINKELSNAEASFREIMAPSLNANLRPDQKITLLKKGYQDKFISPIIEKIGVMQYNEYNLLNLRDQRVTKFSAIVNYVNLISLALVFLIIFWTFYNFSQQNKARIEAKKQSELYKHQLEEKVKALNLANRDLENAKNEIYELKQVEKFASSGRIARSIAHEIRNPLTNINLATQQLKEDIANEEQTSILKLISRNSQRINDMVSNLLNATRAAELNLKKHSLNDIVENAVNLASDRIRLKNIQLEKEFTSQCTDVLMDPSKVEIAMLNIIVNAIESMDKTNTPKLSLRTYTTEQHCVVAIKDNGQGIGKDTLENIFDPFYTQKEKGMGLGLTNTQNIILNHNGKIDVKSEEGVGTTFFIKFPQYKI